MARYKIASLEGAQRYGGEVDDVVDLSLDEREEVAVVAAGWIEPEKKTKEATR